MRIGNLQLLVRYERNVFRFIVWFSIAFMALLRFSNLLADPPLGFTSSISYTYTDEGWWTRNAVAIVREGHWYLDDGYNPITALPVIPLLQTLWFKVFGVSLLTARSFCATCSLILSGLVYILVSRFLKSDFALLAPLIILSHFSIFVHSRLALLEIPTLIFVTLALLLVIDSEGQVSNFRVLLSALFLLIGILAKTTAIFGLPMIISVIWLQKQTISDKIRQSSIILSVFLFICLIGGWFFFTSSNYSLEDFSNSTILTKFHTNPLSLLIAPLRIFWRACQVFPILFPLSLFSSLILIKNTQYRFNPLTLSAISWIGAAFLILSSSDYSPPRYMIVFCIPIAIIVPLITDFIFNTAQKKTTQKVVIGVLLLSLVINAFKLGNYFSSLSRSFVVMAEDVATQIEQQGGHSDILMGHFADTVSLVNNIKSINDQIGYRSLDYRIQKFNPGYYISLGAIEPEIKTNLSKYYDVQLLKTYEVYNNSHQNKPVILYQLRPF